MHLTTVWFILIAVLWVGYFVLEGFDFGVGVTMPFLARSDAERRVMINAIGPTWDGNEVWVIVAGGATFAAFPSWYATMFSGFYVPLFLILIALIFRNVAFEYRGKRPGATWKAWWDRAIFWGSVVPALLWGVAFGNVVRGVAIDGRGQVVGSFFDLLHPYALLAGLCTLALFVTHGLVFIALKTTGEIRERALRFAGTTGLATAVIAVAFLGSTYVERRHAPLVAVFCGLAGMAAVCLVGALVALRARREGWAFFGTAATIALAVASLFVSLFPEVMPSSLGPAFSLTTTNASSTDYTLTIMTWVAAVFTPVVVGYQAFTYYVFRRRIGVENLPVATEVTPADLAPVPR